MSRTLQLSIAVSIIAGTVGCDAIDTMKNGLEHSQMVSREIETSIGVKPSVGFQWENGSFASVSVSFEGIPKGRSLEEISDVSRNAVIREFRAKPKEIILSFSVAP